MPAAFSAPDSLTDSALDTVTARARPPTVIVADGARYLFDGGQSVNLAEGAQVDVRALNVVSAAGSDVGNALNVLSFGGDVSANARQQNTVQQTSSESGSLGRATLAGDDFSRRYSVDSHFSNASSSSTISGHRLQSNTHSRTLDQYSAFVPSYSPLENLTLEVATPELPSLQIPGISLDLLNDDGLVGIEGSIGPFTIEAPRLVLGTVSLDGNDVVLSTGYVDLPGLDLGYAQLKVCFLACVENPDPVYLGSFPGRRVDLPGGDLRFEGANPFQGTQINAGQGFALVGAGTITSVPGHIKLTGELTLDLPDPEFSFDFEIPSVLQVDGDDIIGPWSIDGPDVTIEIPPVSVSHTFIDEDAGFAYSATFDGVLCIVKRESECGSASRSEQRQESRVDVLVYSVNGESSSSGSQSIRDQVEVHAGATLTDAGADLIAMSQSSAQAESTNSVVLEDSAQRGLRAANAVNAADAIIGNALNVMSFQPDRPTSAGAGGLLSQSNVFTQFRTRYGQ